MKTKKFKFPKGEHHFQKDKRCKPIPSETLSAILQIYNENQNSMFREEILENLLWKRPIDVKYFFVKKVPFGIMIDPNRIKEISVEDTLTKQRKKFIEIATDVSHLRAANLNKITSANRSLEKNGEIDLCRSPNKGIGDLKKASPDEVAKYLYYNLRWNSGQIPSWLAHLKKFLNNCNDKKFKNRLVKYSNVAKHETEVPALTKIMKGYAELDQESPES